MSVESKIKTAYDQVKAPDDIKVQTLAYIEASRALAEDASTRTSAKTDSDSACLESANTSTSQNARALSSQQYTEVAKWQDGSSNSQRPSSKRRFRVLRNSLLAAAACFVVAAIGLIGYRAYMTPVAYIGLDVNPSIELSVNRFDDVMEAVAINNDGEKLLEACGSLSGKRYDDALNAILQSDFFQQYADDGSLVSVSISSDSDAQAEQLLLQSQQQLDQLPCNTQCDLIDLATREAAREAGMGMGRYRAACELMELDGSYTIDDCATMTMRELRDACDAARNSATSEVKHDDMGVHTENKHEGEHGYGRHGAGHRNRQSG